MSMTCLQDYIGLRGCGAAVPPSGLYVNDLPGISLKQLVNLTNEEETTYVQLWDVIQKRAMNRFSLDVREAMGKHYKLNSLMQGVNLGKQGIDGTGQAITDINTKAGFIIQLNESANYEYVPSPLTSIHIQEIWFFSGAGNVHTFLIWDPYTNEILKNVQHTNLLDGWNKIEINQTFHNNYQQNSWALAVMVLPAVGPDSSGYLYNKETPNNFDVPTCCNVKISGFLTDTPTDPYINDFLQNTTSNTYGLTGTFSIVCSWDAVICQNKTLFSRAFWYLTGIELLTEQLYSTKLNLFTTTNLQRAKELREEYQVEYAKSLEQVAGGFKLNCDCCIDCAGQVQLRETNQFY